MTHDTSTPVRLRWARLRFAIISQLLQSPPPSGELSAAIAELASRSWRHPTNGESLHFSAKTIERWYYLAKDDPNPIAALERKVPSHAGTHPTITPPIEEAIRGLRRDYPGWTQQLVFDNLVALRRDKADLGDLPSYQTVCRFMRGHGLLRHRKPKRHEREPGFVPRERRSFEVTHVHKLWMQSGTCSSPFA